MSGPQKAVEVQASPDGALGTHELDPAGEVPTCKPLLNIGGPPENAPLAVEGAEQVGSGLDEEAEG